MAEGRLLEDDKDEWFYQSMNKYTNLYMFELEFPLDTLEIINETSLCVSGVQAYSRTCELLQLCVPPKLLRHESEEGLCKDRDFKILSGGYADGRIKQVKFVKSSTNLVAGYQDGFSGVVIYEVGDDNRATIVEKCRLPTGNAAVAKGRSLCYMNDKVLLGTTLNEERFSTHQQGIMLSEWRIEDQCHTSTSANSRNIWKSSKDINPGHIIKIKEWTDNTCIFLTSRGTVALYDLRTGSEIPDIFFHATKSPNNIEAEPLPSDSIIFTFDCVPERNQIGVLDSCGGYETFDARFVGRKDVKKSTEDSKDEATTSSKRNTRSRGLLSDFSGLDGVYADSFNIEYEERTKVRENERIRFIISGLKRECVPVFEEDFENADTDTACVQSVFTHDGHSKPVTHANWHPASANLIFSASIDAVLHAWQFIP